METTTEIPTNTYRALTGHDRCDYCTVGQASVRAVKEIDGESLELIFCSHHFNKHEAVLITKGFLIQDDRALSATLEH
jgi:hypothetical protein